MSDPARRKGLAIANELTSLGGKYTRLQGAEGNGDRVADLLIADAHRLGEALVEELDLVDRELREVAAHGHRYAADRAEAWQALHAIEHVLDTHNVAGGPAERIRDIIAASGVQ